MVSVDHTGSQGSLERSVVAATVRLGEWGSSLSVTFLPTSVVNEAKRCIIDTVGVSLVGAREATAQLVRKHVAEEYASGPCTIFGTGNRFSATGAALANATSAHVLDYDDTSYAGIVHASAVVWPAVLAAGEVASISGEDALVAFIAGCEIEYALGQALGNVSYWKGWWNTAVLGSIGAAAGAARALSLNAEQTTNAINIAASQAGGMRSVLGTSAKPYLCGRAAQTGVAAALSARMGLSGPALALEHSYGLASLVNDGAFNVSAFNDLGRTYALIDPGIAIKMFPVCSASQAAMEATLEILIEHKLADDDIAHVHCDVTPLVLLSLTYAQPNTPTERQFSMQYAIACMILFRDLDPDMLSGPNAKDQRLGTVMRKISMNGDETLFASAEELKNFPEGAVVRITTRDGREIVRRKGAATGMPSNRMPDVKLHEKFFSCAKHALRPDGARSLLDRLIALEQQPSINSLMKDL